MKIQKCVKCGKYTMKDLCGCGAKALSPKPPKFSPEDSYGSYRREVKRPELEKRGLI